MAKIKDLNTEHLKKKHIDSKYSLTGVLLGSVLIFVFYLSQAGDVHSKLWETRPVMKYAIPMVLSLGIIIPAIIRFVKVNREINKRKSN